MTPDEVRALREAGRHDEHLAAARTLVRDAPHDVRAQLEAAYAHDRAGLERDAIRHYDRAFELGVPAALSRSFLVGYGSTLRNVGRADDAVAILGQALVEHPGDPALTAFLALALADAGYPRAALGTMLGCALDVARPGAFAGYERALTAYHRLLLEPPP